MKDAIIADIRSETINGEAAELLCLHNGLVIAITASALRCYKNIGVIGDPLGNGLLSFAHLSEAAHIQFNDQQRCIDRHRSGYVGLIDGKAILIAPFQVRLYPNNQDGLRGLNCMATLELPEIDVY